jgi:ABC-type xylose transport system permease subunit
MSQPKSLIRMRSTWITSMLACGLFLLIMIKNYSLSVDTIMQNFVYILAGLIIILIPTALLGWAFSKIRGRHK